jgi:UDP-2,3-diacylglucosamine pyrophosphatase LpxH
MMTSPEAVAVISDLHICRGDGWSLEDFKSDAQMIALTEFLNNRFAGRRLDLVILGDIFDLWQTVPAADLTAPKAGDIDPTLNIATYQQDLALIAQNHQDFFKALARFSGKPEHRLVIVAGNHDHAFVHAAFQASFKDLLVKTFQFQDRGDNLFFPDYHFYSAPELGVYMEHGNQYDKFNKYREFNHFGPDPRQDECQGYGLVRLFWNRLENLDPDIDDTPEHWGEWFSWIVRHGKPKTLIKACTWNNQYQGDPRIDPITIPNYMHQSALSVTSATGQKHLTTPDILLNSQDKNPHMVFSSDLVVEDAYRKLYAADMEFRQATDAILQNKFAPAPAPDITKLPPLGSVAHLDLKGEAKPIYPAAGAAQSLIYGEPLMRSLQAMFTPGQGPNLYRDAHGNKTHLNSKTYQMVIMGHTHIPRWEQIPGYTQKLYANTGSWTTRATNGGSKTERTVVLVEKRSDQEIWAEAGVITDAGGYQLVNGPSHLPKPS